MNSPAQPQAQERDAIGRAARVRLACFDVDGTLTDGRLLFDSEGRELKAFHVHDGQGLVLLRKAGIHVALITARNSVIAERRAAELGIGAHVGVADKLAVVDGLCAQLGIGLEHVAFMGDDLTDLAAMQAVGLAAAPADGHPDTARHAHWRARNGGGLGAARELCDFILLAQGATPALPEAGNVQ